MSHPSDRFRSASVVRRAFLDFFAAKGHEEVASSSLVPQNDPTLLFANAGMNQFKDVFTGKSRRARSRATTSQKCVRAGGKHNDLENVGRTARHHTFFEMLGNFSFGDYFKEGAITFASELLTEVYGLPLDRLVFTVHYSDDEARQLWKSIAGVSDERIISLGDKDNFWAMGDTGPCGPCSEIHYHQGDDLPCAEVAAGRPCQGPACDCDRWVEIWNLVFMQFEQMPDGTRAPLPRPSVDTGMGLERLCAVLQGKRSNYETDLLSPLIETASKLAKKTFDPADFRENSTSVSLRAIADHARATAFLIADGVFPEKTRREYVLRRIMRRAIYHGDLLGIKEQFFAKMAAQVIDLMAAAYPELDERRGTILEVADQEERRFRETLDRGVRILGDESQKLTGKVVPGELAFRLYDTYGFPLDLTRVIANARNLELDEAGFEEQMEAQRKRASFVGSGELAVETVFQAVADRVGATRFLGYETLQTPGQVVALVAGGKEVERVSVGAAGAATSFAFVCAETPFYGESGGQMGDIGTAEGPAGSVRILDTKRPVTGLSVHIAELTRGEVKVGDALDLRVDAAHRNAIRRNHSATHLLHWALRTTLGEHVAQKGSLVGAEKLRFDFSHFAPLSRDEKEKVEDLVNARVVDNAPVQTDVVPIAEAKAAGAMAFFGEKYADTVRMLSMAESKELCGGTHVQRTGDIGLFKIVEEAGVAQGVRRIEAVTGLGAALFVRRMEHELVSTAEQLKSSPFEVAGKVERLANELRGRDKDIEKLRSQLASGGGKDLTASAQKIGDVSVLVTDVPVSDAKILRETADKLRDKLNPSIVVLVGSEGDKVSVVSVVSKDALPRFHAGKILSELVKAIDGKGGGRPDMAQGGGTKPADLGKVLDAWRATVADVVARG
ncbi:MAG: alanine--tRNA ligase [Deltaproteobacteria bacterium]|nr:alanine--tRNA ligase [Deltaproteobacteria bacterium]